MNHRPPVAHQLAGELSGTGAPRNWAVCDLLREHQRLLLGPRSRLVVALEGEEDDEAEQHGESGREHAEDSRGAVAVGEAAALGRTAPHEQHRRHGEGGHGGNDEHCPDEVHREASAPARSPLERPSPAGEDAVDSLGADNGVVGERESDRVQDESPRLGPSQPAVERDQLLERAALFEIRVVEAADHDVGHVGEPVRS